MNLRILLIPLLFISLLSNVYAQQKSDKKQDFPIHLSILDESTSLPNFWFLRYAYNPAFIVGTEYTLTHDWHLTGNLGFFYRKEWQTAVFLLPEIGYRRHLNRWSFYPRLGLGYTHSFVARPVYKFEGTQFQEVSNLGSPFLTGSLSLNLSYQLKDQERSPEIYCSFMMMALVPFNNWAGLHQLVGVGYKFYPFKND
ncbi:MAG: hypothetical protein AAF806_30360 [Bacteroidota bacterium]